MASEPVREGFHTITPYLIVEDLDACIEFIKAAFGNINYGTCQST